MKNQLNVSYLPCCRLPQSSHIAKSLKNRLQRCKSRNLTEETLKILCFSGPKGDGPLAPLGAPLQPTLIKCGAETQKPKRRSYRLNEPVISTLARNSSRAKRRSQNGGAETQKPKRSSFSEHASSEQLSSDVSVQSENLPTPSNPRPETTSKSKQLMNPTLLKVSRRRLRTANVMYGSISTMHRRKIPRRKFA